MDEADGADGPAGMGVTAGRPGGAPGLAAGATAGRRGGRPGFAAGPVARPGGGAVEGGTGRA